MPRDHKAEFGYKPTWDLQRKKQEAVAEEFYGETKVPEPEDLNDGED